MLLHSLFKQSKVTYKFHVSHLCSSRDRGEVFLLLGANGVCKIEIQMGKNKILRIYFYGNIMALGLSNMNLM